MSDPKIHHFIRPKPVRRRFRIEPFHIQVALLFGLFGAAAFLATLLASSCVEGFCR